MSGHGRVLWVVSLIGVIDWLLVFGVVERLLVYAYLVVCLSVCLFVCLFVLCQRGSLPELYYIA